MKILGIIYLILAMIILSSVIYGHFYHHTSCNYGDSSISGHFNKKHTVFIIDHPAHKTGC